MRYLLIKNTGQKRKEIKVIEEREKEQEQELKQDGI